MTRRRQRVGKAGEAAAQSYLQRKGYRVAEVNYRSPYGEIDIVAFHGSILVFVEVRTRTGSSFGTPAESITAEKLNHLTVGAGEHGIDQPPALPGNCRIILDELLLYYHLHEKG